MQRRGLGTGDWQRPRRATTTRNDNGGRGGPRPYDRRINPAATRSAASGEAWAEATGALERAHADLRRAVLALGDGHLDDRTPGRPYSLYVLLHGIVQHTAYHAGQVALLKRGAADR